LKLLEQRRENKNLYSKEEMDRADLVEVCGVVQEGDKASSLLNGIIASPLLGRSLEYVT
jgi:hypothetical protein